MSETRRICHVATMTRWGGVERMLADVLLFTRGRQLHHSLLTTSSVEDVRQPLLDAGIHAFQPKRRWRYDPATLVEMSMWLREQGIQIAHGYNSFANAWGFIAAKLARFTHFIAGEHGTVWVAQPPIAWLDRVAQRRACVVIANSEASAMMSRLRYGVSSQKIRVVPNAVPTLPPADLPAIRSEFNLDDKLVVGSVGRLDTPKNFAVFVESAALLLPKNPNLVFMLIGGGPLEAELSERMQTLGIAHRFIMTGWRSDARQLIQAFDIFVSTSLQESFGNVLIEAGHAGIPVIAPAVDGIPEAVADRKTGLLLTPTEPATRPRASLATPMPKFSLRASTLISPLSLDPKILAEAIAHLLERPDLRQQYGYAGQIQAQERFSLERYIAELESIYLNTGMAMHTSPDDNG